MYSVAATNTAWNNDHEYSTPPSSLSQTLDWLSTASNGLCESPLSLAATEAYYNNNECPGLPATIGADLEQNDRGNLPGFSVSGTVISDTFDADFNELYSKHTIQMIKPTMLVLSNVICKESGREQGVRGE